MKSNEIIPSSVKNSLVLVPFAEIEALDEKALAILNSSDAILTY
jgi:hypothetical protein